MTKAQRIAASYQPFTNPFNLQDWQMVKQLKQYYSDYTARKVVEILFTTNTNNQ